jgi:hypothetical protein
MTQEDKRFTKSIMNTKILHANVGELKLHRHLDTLAAWIEQETLHFPECFKKNFVHSRNHLVFWYPVKSLYELSPLLHRLHKDSVSNSG